MNRNKIFYSVAASTASLFFAMDFFRQGTDNHTQFIVLNVLFNLIYIFGWLFSIKALLQAKASGNISFAKNLFELQLSLFFIANACNVLVILEANEFSYFSRMCEFFWIASNVFMTLTAIIAINSHNHGWKKYLMTATAIWIPLSLLVFKLLRNSMVYSIVIVVYPTLACLLVGYMASSTPETTTQQNQCVGRKKYRSQKKYMLAIN